ncbi:u3 small nucleolar RNA-associated protein 10 [Moniliophthora roreri MCA 2997]|uniref:U3 small nucleolar RNA-associated protein 10 n=1 Tax=Moniliophthora roreri (strain MCA 2997) TaxID=1381753 RepID=V2XSJ7_MONRO|nr:u3 small nucleolar RNA-associated protein 10 [Moniliophthora roreri MCA 2997]
MVSSLAAQLAQNASLNSSLLVDRSRRKQTESYLFTGKDADQYDLDSLYALAVNGFLQLVSLNPTLGTYEDALFSHSAKSTDRTLLTAEANSELDASISSFLQALGPYLMEAPTGKVIEWLVRRFRINEFNVEDILALFLPYHETPHFAKMNTILHIKPNTTWSFLLPFKSAAQSVPRIALVSEMTKNTVAARFIASLLPNAIKEERAHRTLIAFNAATLCDFITRSKSLDEGTLAYLLPALVDPLQIESPKEAILGSYILIATLSHKCSLTPAALKAFLVAMISRAHQVSVTQLVNALISVCEPQEILDELPSSTVKTFLRVKNINQEIREALGWEGSEKLIIPLLSGLVRRLKDASAIEFAEILISTLSVHQIILHRLTALLLEQAVAAEPSELPKQLLHDILQRHPAVYRAVVDEFSQKEDETLKISIEQLTITLTMGYTSPKNTSESIDAIVGSSNADEKLRANAVKTLLETVSDAAESEVHSLHSAILSRIQDTSQTVLEVLYNSNPAILLQVALQRPQLYIDNVNATLSSIAKPKRAILKLHLGFLADRFFAKIDGDKEKENIISDAFHNLFFPFLLYSKPRQHTADLVWDIVIQCLSRLKGSLAVKELLKGCDEARKATTDEDNEGEGDSVEKMVRVNTLLAARIAENILSSNDFTEHLEKLVQKLNNSNPHVRVFSYLIAKAFIGRLSGEHQIDAARRVLATLNEEQIMSIDESADDVTESLGNVERSVVLKPNKQTTMSWIQVSVLRTIAEVTPPDGLVVDFITSLPQRHSDDRGYRYTQLVRDVYRLSNTLSADLKRIQLSALFASLKNDALLFFAGVWLSDSEDQRNVKDSSSLKRLALNHAQAFLEAAAEDDGAGIDFQTIIPAVLVACCDHNADVRKAAVGLLGLIKRATMEKKFGSVYAFDLVYGGGDHAIQYLTQEEFKKYMASLTDHVEHFLYDAGYIRVFHKDHISRAKGDSKKESNYKHNVLCYLLAHINAMSQPSAQCVLLNIVADVPGKAKAEILLPTMETLVSGSPQDAALRLYGSYLSEIARLTAASFDISVAQELNEKPHLWEIFVALARASISSAVMASTRSVIADNLKNNLFTKLKREKKVELCLMLVEQGAIEESATHVYVKSLLSSILDESIVMTQLLEILRSEVAEGEPRATKRAKLEDNAPDDVILRLGLLAEVMGTMSLPGSFDLISHLLETLSKVMQFSNTARADVIFIEQSLMAAVDNAAGKVQEIPNLAPNAIRLDVLVELIRITDNPQTFHQALLLIANLARLAPESVLHNIMPVFTFMGSNVFHRDDAYSFAVVQKTVGSIVPVMVSSLKRSHNSRLELYIGARDFLRVFTDAANHIPRHRRANFFAHLVDVLGPADFLAPVCLLLVEKSTNRVIRQNTDEVMSALALPISLIHHYSPSLQIFALVEMIRESDRLADRTNGVNTSQVTLLDDSLSEEHSLAPAIMCRRRAQAIVTFIAYSIKAFPSDMVPQDGDSLSDLVALLITLATKQGGSSPETKIEEINNTARFAMDKVLTVVSATDFIAAIQSMLSSGNQLVQGGALDLLSSRLPRISGTVRQAVTTAVVQIVEAVKRLLSQNPEKPIAVSAFKALRAIGTTLSSGEESCLTNLVPVMITATRDRDLATAAMSALASLPEKLGPRLIPFFRELVAQGVATLRSAGDDLARETVTLLQGLLVSIPTFWSAVEISQVFKLFLDFTQQPQNGIAALVKSITKRAPAKVLLPTVCDLWSGIERASQTDVLNGYLDILKRSVRHAARTTVQEHLRALFNVFLAAFEVTKSQDMAKGKPKELAVSAFVELVVKLNEPTFRPLFRRLHDWTFVSGSDLARQVTFCQVYSGLLDYFKNLMTPYMSMLVSPFLEVLKGYLDSKTDSKELLIATLETLGKSIACDDGGFWRDEKIRQLTPSLVGLIPVCVKLNIAEAKVPLQEALSSAVEHVTDDTLLKSVNLDILMHTRSEDAGTRIFALSTSESLWKTHGGKLLGFVAETATFIAECCEDEHDTVARESFKLKDAVESVAGSINGI